MVVYNKALGFYGAYFGRPIWEMRFSNVFSSKNVTEQPRLIWSRKLCAARPRSQEILRRRIEIWENIKTRTADEYDSAPPMNHPEKISFFSLDSKQCHVVPSQNLRKTRPIDLPWISCDKNALVSRITFGNIETEDCFNSKAPKNSVLWDLTRDFSDIPEYGKGCFTVHGCDFNTQDGASVFWHSSAHLLGHAIELEYGLECVNLCDGPSLEASFDSMGLIRPGSGGFFYDFKFFDGRKTQEHADLKKLTSKMIKNLKGSTPFERLALSEEDAKELFEYNPEKIAMIDKIVRSSPDPPKLTAYKTGSFIDLCRGPHVPSTSHIGVAAKARASYSISDGTQTRVYGVSFPSKDLLKEWEERTNDASRRDHRLIGQKQRLFTFHHYSPGSAFFLPHGTVVFNRLLGMLRDQYSIRGYKEVITPIVYSSKLWDQSGHLENYRENMYRIVENDKVENANDEGNCCASLPAVDSVDEEMGLKPMNCPGHCLVFPTMVTSFRDLPLRVADFSALHRNEATGALTGLTRVRKFHQDDAHIFCTPEQVSSEISACLNFINYVYRELFNFDISLVLSTKGDGAGLGSDEEWQGVESALSSALDETGLPWEFDVGEAAFYGPKIDCSITDALGRKHQCATIQLDVQLPKRFDLKYQDSLNTSQRPVMIHRAILGSLERFMAILLEHTNGKLPFWLSPRQVAVVPVDSVSHLSYANSVASQIRECCLHEGSKESGFLNRESGAGLSVSVESSSVGFNKRIRDAQQAPYNVIVVVGQAEENDLTVSVKSNDWTQSAVLPVEVFLKGLIHAVKHRTNAVFPNFDSQ